MMTRHGTVTAVRDGEFTVETEQGSVTVQAEPFVVVGDRVEIWISKIHGWEVRRVVPQVHWGKYTDGD